MSLASLSQKTTTTGKGLAALAGIKPAGKLDLSSVEGLGITAAKAGLEEQAKVITEEPAKLSFLQRLGTGLSALNPAEAILTATEKGIVPGVSKYVSGVVKGIGSAITGTDYEGERRMFADVAEKLGVENSIAKFGIGFAGDVLLDPSTYFGGAIVKGLTAGVKGATGVALKGIGKVAPEVETGLKLVGTGLEDALGRAFQYGYKASKGAKEDILSFLSKEQQAKLGLASSNLDRLGAGTLSPSQREELALKMIAGKRAEFTQRQLSEDIVQSAEWFQPLKNRLVRLLDTREKDLGKLGTEINNLEKKGLKTALKKTKEEVLPSKVSSVKIKTVPEKQQVVAFDKYDIPTREISPATPLKRTSTDAELVSLSSRETGQFVNSLIRKSKPELEAIKKMIGTREGWKNDLLNEITGLRNEFEGLAKSQQDTFKLADAVFAQRGAVARETAQSSNPIVQKAIEEQIARGKKFAEGITENPYETYFPFIKKDKLEKFLSESKGIKVGSEGYRKQFKNLLTNENMELDPAKAFFTRESQIVSDKMTRDFLSGFVEKYGKKLDAFKNTDEATKAGYRLIKEKGIFGKELGWVQEFDEKLIRDSISPEFQTVNMLAKATGYDAVTSLFKRSVTGLFAPFHIRNFVSGNIQNFEVLGVDALNPKNISAGQKIAYLLSKGAKVPEGTIEIAGKTEKFSSIIKPFAERFSGDTFYSNDFLTAIDKGTELKQVAGAFSKEALKETGKTLGLGQEGTPFKVARAIGQYIETQQKATAYITALGQGKKIDEALRLAEAAGFDYRALTKFESQIMRRIIPFYSFTRKNIELQMKTLGENPERINQVLRFFGNVGENPSEEEKKNLPDFIKESIGVKLKDTPEGLQQYISSFGTPIEAFTQLFGSNPILRAISTMNPLLKVPIELGIGKDSFRQRDLKDVYNANEYKFAPQVLKDLLEIKEVKKPVYKTINGKSKIVGEKTAYIANPERLLIARSLFTSRGVTYLDQVFGNDMQGLVKVLKTTTGIKPQQVDIEAQKYFNNRDKQRALEDLLTRYGVTKQFTKTYIPK